jgi:hypothetical protein
VRPERWKNDFVFRISVFHFDNVGQKISKILKAVPKIITPARLSHSEWLQWG